MDNFTIYYLIGLTLVSTVAAFLLYPRAKAANGGVYYFVDEMVKLSDIYTIKTYVGGWSQPTVKRTVNCYVGKEYLGTGKRGHYAM